MNSEPVFIVGSGHDEQEYTVSGVRYTVVPLPASLYRQRLCRFVSLYGRRYADG